MEKKLHNLEKENQRLKTVIEELTFLNDLSRAMSSTLSLQEIMAQIINKSIQVTGVEQGTIMLVDENARTSMKTMIRGVAKTHHGSYLSLDDHIMGWMFENRKSLLSNDVMKDERLAGLEINKDIHSLLSVPMIFRGKLLGVINLFNVNKGFFTEDNEKVMFIFSDAGGVVFSQCHDFCAGGRVQGAAAPADNTSAKGDRRPLRAGWHCRQQSEDA